MPKITAIPATRNIRIPEAPLARRKVAGYARVSTDSDEQFTSYEAQVDYYTKYIRSHADWEFVGVLTPSLLALRLGLSNLLRRMPL